MFALPGFLVTTDPKPFMTGAFGQLFKATAYCKGSRTTSQCVLKSVDCEAAKIVDADLDSSQEAVINYLLARAGPHPNIVQCLSFFNNDKFVNMLFEYASEGDLFEYIQTKGKALPFIFEHSLSLARGLAFCHQNYVIHRDIKPENLLLFNMGPHRPPVLKICDFGLAKYVYNTGGRCRGVCGTVDFMAPEVHLCDKHSPDYTYSVDAWSFGMVVFHMATADLPFGEILSYGREKQNRIISHILQNPHYKYDFRQIADHHLRDLVSRLITYKPENRLNFSQVLQHPFFQTSYVFDPADFKKPSSPLDDTPPLRHSSYLGFP